jgi:arylsulfatase A-like enzyme
MYSPENDNNEMIMPLYTDQADSYLSESDLQNLRANYAAEVTMVDHWFGFFMNKVKLLGLDKNSVIVVVSDHGHVLGEKNITGKLPWGLLPCLLDLVMFIRHPTGEGAGSAVGAFTYNIDLLPTVCQLLNVVPPEWAEGENIWPLVLGEKDDQRDHVSTIYKDHVWVRNETHALISRTDKTHIELFDLENDPECLNNIAQQDSEQVEKMWNLLIEDAGGEIPVQDHISFNIIDRED